MSNILLVHSGMLPANTFGMQKCFLPIFLAKPRLDAEAILKLFMNSFSYTFFPVTITIFLLHMTHRNIHM